MATTKKTATKKSAAKKPAAKTAKPAKKASTTKATAKTAGVRAPHPPRKSVPPAMLERFRAICLSLPETTEVEAWGHPTFRVKDKIFASIGGENGEWSMGMKTTHEMQAGLVASDPRFSIAAYVGK